MNRAYLYLRILECQLSVTAIPLAITRVTLVFRCVIEASVQNGGEDKMEKKKLQIKGEKGVERQCEPKISHQLPSQQKRAETNAFFSTPAATAY